jgi:hypothetical protein
VFPNVGYSLRGIKFANSLSLERSCIRLATASQENVKLGRNSRKWHPVTNALAYYSLFNYFGKKFGTWINRKGRLIVLTRVKVFDWQTLDRNKKVQKTSAKSYKLIYKCTLNTCDTRRNDKFCQIQILCCKIVFRQHDRFLAFLQHFLKCFLFFTGLKVNVKVKEDEVCTTPECALAGKVTLLIGAATLSPLAFVRMAFGRMTFRWIAFNRITLM